MSRTFVRRIVISVMAIAFLGLFSAVWAEKKWETITAMELKVRVDSGEDICLVNVLPKVIFNNGHIPGSINIPIGKLSRSSDLPKDKNTPLVFYCMGVA